MEELEESVWSVVRQKNERKDQGEGVLDSGKTGTCGLMHMKINWSSQKRECYDGCAELRSWMR